MARTHSLLVASLVVATVLGQSQSGVPLDTLYVIQGDQPFEALGSFPESVAATADMDRDGVADLIVGSPLRPSGLSRRGTVTVYSGRSQCRILQLQGSGIDGGNPQGDAFGLAVAAAGDLNGDQVPDLVVGSPFEASAGYESGKVFVISGVDGSVLRTFSGTGQDQLFGYAVAIVGDVDGRGLPDLLVGAHGRNGAGGNGPTEYARLFALEDGALLRHITRSSINDSFGFAVTGLGDVDGDQVPDYAIGAPTAAAGQRGVVVVFSGGSQASVVLQGINPLDAFGQCIDAGDADRDGLADLIVGAPADPGAGPAFARVYSGASLGAALTSTGTPVVILHVQDTGNFFTDFGSAVAFAGDVDGDPAGRQEILVGAQYHQSGVPPVGAGGAWLFPVIPGQLTPLPVFEILGGRDPLGNPDQLGTALAGGFDFTGDGLADIVVGSGGEDLPPVTQTVRNQGAFHVLGFSGPNQHPYPGTGGDLLLETCVPGNSCAGSVGVKTLHPGQLLCVRISTPGGTLAFGQVLFSAQLFPTGTPPLFPAIPGLHLDPGRFLTDPRFSPILFIVSSTPIGPVLLSPQGLTLNAFVVPSWLLNRSVMLQAAVFSPAAAAGYALSDGHEIRVRS